MAETTKETAIAAHTPAMGAGVLRKKIQDAGLSQISVTNSAINNLPPDVDLVCFWDSERA